MRDLSGSFNQVIVVPVTTVVNCKTWSKQKPAYNYTGINLLKKLRALPIVSYCPWFSSAPSFQLNIFQNTEWINLL